jgi:hypothetical protein
MHLDLAGAGGGYGAVDLPELVKRVEFRDPHTGTGYFLKRLSNAKRASLGPRGDWLVFTTGWLAVAVASRATVTRGPKNSHSFG